MRINLIILMFPLLTHAQVGFFHFEVRGNEVGSSKEMTITKKNKCNEWTDLKVDFGNFTVPDKLIVKTPKGDTLTETDWVGAHYFAGQIPDLALGFALYNDGQLMRQNSFIPSDFGLDQFIHFNYRTGTGRILLRTKEEELIIEWKSNPTQESHTDIYIHATSFFEELPEETFIDNFVCEEPDIEYDTIRDKCQWTIIHNHFVGESGSKDTICGFEGDYVDGVRIDGDDIIFYDRINEFGCEYQDTLIVREVKLYIPNVCTDRYYLNPEIEFEVYDRWGELVFKGTQWDSEPFEQDVYMVKVDYKGRTFMKSITKL